ncbi:MAG: alpha/beta hydrolase [Rhizobiaceae bacterium]
MLIYGTGVLALLLFAATRYLVSDIEKRFPPIGSFAEVDGIRMHYVELQADKPDLLTPVIFIHGASGNARDLFGAFAGPLKDRAHMLFFDRPGAGYSSRKASGDERTEAQADYLAGLMDQLGISRAIIVGHSLGGAVQAAFAVRHPQKVAALLFVAPASHPWPGRDISWYYGITNLPVIGSIFANFLSTPAGMILYRDSVKSVFAPNKPPADYPDRSATKLVLRPASFLANAADVGALYDNNERLSARYGEISAPTVIVSGDSDATVRADIHSEGLARQIAGSKLIWLPKTGHMPTYSATARLVEELEKLDRVVTDLAAR